MHTHARDAQEWPESRRSQHLHATPSQLLAGSALRSPPTGPLRVRQRGRSLSALRHSPTVGGVQRLLSALQGKSPYGRRRRALRRRKKNRRVDLILLYIPRGDTFVFVFVRAAHNSLPPNPSRRRASRFTAHALTDRRVSRTRRARCFRATVCAFSVVPALSHPEPSVEAATLVISYLGAWTPHCGHKPCRRPSRRLSVTTRS